LTQLIKLIYGNIVGEWVQSGCDLYYKLPGVMPVAMMRSTFNRYLGMTMLHQACTAVLTLFMLVSMANVEAAPYVPASDNVVLERLPFKPNDPIAREMSQLRSELVRNPQNSEIAVRLAQRYYGLVAEEGDPRYLGYAQAVLAPWWEMPQPPIDVQVLRASLAQFRHDFSGALNDLNSVLERDPRHAQARALRATIHIVQARYEQARADCTALHGVSSELIALACEAMVDGLTGKTATAYPKLNADLKATPQATPSEKLWVQIRLAEMAQRLGQSENAEAHFKHALALHITDTFLLAAYADFLLNEKRPAEVVAMLKDKTPSDVLLLRLVLAERALQLPTAKERESILAARYAAAQLRGDTVHQQEEARFSLQVQHDPQKALKLAQENWKVQREPRDARIFLEAAVAIKDPVAAQPVLQWLSDSHHEDRTLLNLAQQLTGEKK
jgi:tetratricopeptide (TPR) repeat protein